MQGGTAAGSVSSGIGNSAGSTGSDAYGSEGEISCSTDTSVDAGQSAREQIMQNGEQWAKNLTPEEKEAFRQYTGTAYSNINRVLRGTEKEMSPRNREYAKTLHRKLKQAQLPQDCIVYRGTSDKALGMVRHLPDKMLEGRIFMDEGFMSTSLSREEAFAGDVLLEIEAPKGSKGMYVGYCSSVGHCESEVLFDAGQTMRIKSVQRDKHGRRIIRVVII